MRISSKTMAAGVITLAMAAGGAQAQEAMATAGATGAAPSDAVASEPAPTPPAAAAPLEDTAAQIQRWIADSPTNADDRDGQLLDLRREDRQMHGEVGMAVGTGGYRSGYITSVMPIGESGTLALTIGQEKNGVWRYWNRAGRPYGAFDYGYGLAR